MPNNFDLLRYAATGIASPDMTYYDRMIASTLIGGAVKTLTGIPPLSFKADGKPLISWSMKGNGSQTGTPTPDAPIMPDFCGTLDGADWKIPITCAGQTVPVYLGQVSTVRRVKKLVLTGEEEFGRNSGNSVFYTSIGNGLGGSAGIVTTLCSHYPTQSNVSSYSAMTDTTAATKSDGSQIWIRDTSITSATMFKTWLAGQYAAGTPVTVWYVLATPETGTVNESLCKIGDYADELNSTDAAITIPTVKGQNTLTVDTNLQPSEMTITYRG